MSRNKREIPVHCFVGYQPQRKYRKENIKESTFLVNMNEVYLPLRYSKSCVVQHFTNRHILLSGTLEISIELFPYENTAHSLRVDPDAARRCSLWCC